MTRKYTMASEVRSARMAFRLVAGAAAVTVGGTAAYVAMIGPMPDPSIRYAVGGMIGLSVGLVNVAAITAMHLHDVKKWARQRGLRL